METPRSTSPLDPISPEKKKTRMSQAVPVAEVVRDGGILCKVHDGPPLVVPPKVENVAEVRVSPP